MSGKIKARNITSQKVGPTFDANDPAKFTNHGKTSGKTMANGIEDQAKGAVFTCNETHIPTMNADKPVLMSKQLTDKKWFDPHSTNKTRDADEPVKTNAPYNLKTSYRK